MLKREFKKLPLIIAALSFLSVLSGCVGTVDTTKKPITYFEDPAKESFFYTGIQSVRAIADDKVEVDFNAYGGNTDLYDYFLYINDAPQGLKLDLSTIKQVQGGLYRYVLKDLTINTTYSLVLRAENKSTGALSEGGNSFLVKTFDNQVADFHGAAQVYLVPGQSSTTAVVEWNPATFTGLSSANSFDPIYYMVYYVSDAQGIHSLYNPATRNQVRMPGGSSRITKNNHASNVSTTINTLAPDTTYHFMVRAIHKAHEDTPDSDLDLESNNIIITITTDSSGSVPDFTANSLQVQNAPGIDAFTKMRAFWDAGLGGYTGYRFFVKRYEGSDFDNDDELDLEDDLTETDGSGNYVNLLNCINVAPASSGGIAEGALPADFDTDPSKIACFNLPPSLTSFQITGLSRYKPYNFKVALCRTLDCPLETTDPDAGMLSILRAKRTFPELAPFTGIDTINNPSDINNLTRISSRFNPVVTSIGYADTFELNCVDPTDYNNYVTFPSDGSQIAGQIGNLARCNGLDALRYSNENPLSGLNNYGAISSETGVFINGVNTGGNTNYCFSINPAITQESQAPTSEFDYDGNKHLRPALADRIVRCHIPEVKPPTASEFPGVAGSCEVVNDTATITWNTPTGGLYHDYIVVQKVKEAAPFSYISAISGAASYTLIDQPLGTSTYQATGLTPGQTYQFGVVTRLDIGGGDYLYSESNTGIVECNIQLPVATFKEWTRVLAVGPKIDGRVPEANPTDDLNPWPTYQKGDTGVDARVYEAVSPQGQVYEVIDAADPDVFAPPGFSTSFGLTNDNFDGIRNGETTNIAASKTGIISLAWKHVDLDFLDTEFKTAQTNSMPRISRTYGYRVYRSSDYGVSWTNLSGDQLIHAVDYNFKEGPNEATTPIKMAFFTDYSARALESNAQVDRARLYLYKIVPVYQGMELSYDDDRENPHHILRVTLPPPNMALIHRKMANRQACMEVGKYDEIDVDNHYRCAYNGVGARMQDFPWRLGFTVVDQGGDMLVDRFELGCNYTRGDNNPIVQSSRSYFHDGMDSGIGDMLNNLGDFKGYRGDTSPSTSVFRGCVSKSLNNLGRGASDIGGDNNPDPGDSDNPYTDEEISYDRTIFGDCLGNDNISIPWSYCSNPLACPGTYTMSFPGASGSGFTSTTIDNNNPHFAFGDQPTALNPVGSGGRTRVGRLDRDRRRYVVAQGEFGAVYYNVSGTNSSRSLSPYGQGYSNGANSHETLVSQGDWGFKRVCSLNIPSIDNDGSWRSRWFDLDALRRVTFHNQDEINPATGTNYTAAEAVVPIIDKTLDEVLNSRALYDDWKGDPNQKNYRNPLGVDSNFFNADRIHMDMPIGRIVASNNAKLPPLVGGNQQTFNQICQTYEVQVGVGDEVGGFQALSAPTAKRLLNRHEHILAAAWPEEFSGSQIIALERGNATFQLPGILTGGDDYARSCKAAYNNLTGGYTPLVDRRLLGDYGYANISGQPLITGSGKIDENAEIRRSSTHCQSRYGIQDLVGNLTEIHGIQIFCDYSTNSMGLYFGVDGDKTQSVALPHVNPSDGQGADNYYPITGADKIEICKYTSTPPSGNWYPSGPNHYCATNDEVPLAPWKEVTPLAGYCSVVDNNLNRPNDFSNFRTSSGDFHPIVNGNGDVNTNMILNPNTFDPLNILGMRNGDGYFLNFGPGNLAPALTVANALSFASAVSVPAAATNLYFSPLLGLPLTCGDYAGGNSCDSITAGDNRKKSLASYEDNHPGTPAAFPPETETFFIGNSSMTNRGLSETRGSALVPDMITYGGNDNGGRYIVTRLTENSSGSVSETRFTSDSFPETTAQAFNYFWDLQRGVTLSLQSGGASNNSNSGRYTASIQPWINNGNEGARCMVMINQDD